MKYLLLFLAFATSAFAQYTGTPSKIVGSGGNSVIANPDGSVSVNPAAGQGLLSYGTGVSGFYNAPIEMGSLSLTGANVSGASLLRLGFDGTGLKYSANGSAWAALGGSGANGIATVTAKSANFTVATSEKGAIFDVTTGASNMTATLPAAATAGNGWYCFVRKSDTGVGLVLTSPTTLPAPVSAQVQNALVLVWSDGTNWYNKVHLGNVDAAGNVTVAAGGANGNMTFNTTGTGNLIFDGSGTSSALLFAEDNQNDIGAAGATRPRNIYAGTAGYFPGFYVGGSNGSNSAISSSSSGNITLYNGNITGFSQLQLGGLTSSFPSLKRNAATLEARLADDSGFADLKLRQLLPDSTITAAGTTGAQTINKGAFTARFASGATSLVVTNSLATASTKVITTVQTNDSTCKSIIAVSGAGFITFYPNSTPTSEIEFYGELRN